MESPPPNPPSTPATTLLDSCNKFQTPAPAAVSSSTSFPQPKIEDSPVFNYINNLSPIKPPQSTHSGQSFQFIGFQSPQSSSVSLPITGPKRSEVLSGSGVSILSNAEISMSGGDGSKSQEISDAQNVNQLDSGGDIISRAEEELTKPAVDLYRSLTYDSGGPEGNCNHTEKDYRSKRNAMGILTEDELDFYQFQAGQTKEALGYDWDKLFCDADDLLICCSPVEEGKIEKHDDNSLDSGKVSFVASVSQVQHEYVENMLDLRSISPASSSEVCGIQGSSSQLLEEEMAEAHCPSQSAHDSIAVAEKSLDEFNSEARKRPSIQKQPTLRKRCLVFEVSGAQYRRQMSDIGTSAVSIDTPDEKHLFGKLGSSKVSSLLPGIGLHLNALATSTREKIIVKQDALTRKRQLISTPAMGSFGSMSSSPKALNTNSAKDSANSEVGFENYTELASNHVENESKQSNTDLQVTENTCQSLPTGQSEELNHSSPRKKRRKSENEGEDDGCKRCNCKRSKCLKLYCECFAAGLYCSDPCTCQDCFNRPDFVESVLQTRRQIESRNPLAFAPKVIRIADSSEYEAESNKTPASARHKRGCNCKKSNCLKRYCECFQGGVGCSPSCRCEACKNSFGQKEGLQYPAFEAIGCSGKSKRDPVKIAADLEKNTVDPEKVTTDQEKGAPDSNFDVAKDNKEVEQQDPQLLPFQSCRGQVILPFLFGGLSAQARSVSSGLSLHLCTNQNLVKHNLGSDPHNNHLPVIPEDEAPDFLIDDASPTTSIKSISPNRKRISPPFRESGSPGWKSSRKLILKSIPSFPSLTPPNGIDQVHGSTQ